MIFPTPVNPRNIQLYPITWMLVVLNVFLFMLWFADETSPSIDESFFKEPNLKKTGILYHHRFFPQDTLRQYSETQVMSWGIQAIKDKKFFSEVERLEPWGDQLEFKDWQKLAVQFRDEYLTQASYKFGLSSQSRAPLNWITYQFSHASWSHLLSNMAFLLIMGAAVEGLVGGFALLGLYLCGGTIGGMTFLFFNSHGLSPLVGASAAISALMGFYAFYEPRQRVRYFFLLSPFEFIYLSPLLIIPIFLVSDWTSWLSSPDEWPGSIAYTAHLGGAILGVGMALSYKYIWKIKPLTLKN